MRDYMTYSAPVAGGGRISFLLLEIGTVGTFS